MDLELKIAQYSTLLTAKKAGMFRPTLLLKNWLRKSRIQPPIEGGDEQDFPGFQGSTSALRFCRSSDALERALAREP